MAAQLADTVVAIEMHCYRQTAHPITGRLSRLNAFGAICRVRCYWLGRITEPFVAGAVEEKEARLPIHSAGR